MFRLDEIRLDETRLIVCFVSLSLSFELLSLSDFLGGFGLGHSTL